MKEQSANFERFYRRHMVPSFVEMDSALTGGGWLRIQAEAGVPEAVDFLLPQLEKTATGFAYDVGTAEEMAGVATGDSRILI